MADGDAPATALSKREEEVARAYAGGQSYKEIARDLGLSPTTVRSHLRTVYTKLVVTSKIELARFLDEQATPEARDTTEMAADLALELDEAIRRERSLAKALKIISGGGGDFDTVIDAVLEHALEICEAEFGVLFEFLDDGRAREMKSRNIAPEFADWFAETGAFELDPETAIGRMAATRQTVSITDVRGEDVYKSGSPLRLATADLGKARSFAAIPMMSGGRLIGAFTVYRTRVHPFNDRALELAQVFADQSVIAIENARQFQALQDRLERAAATREVLDAIRDYRDDATPVLDVILSRAAQLCGADAAAMTLGREGDTQQSLAAAQDMHPKTRALYTDGKVSMNPETSLVARAIVTGKTLHVPDYADTDDYRAGEEVFRSLVDDTGMRTSINVPLISGGAGIGALVLYRREVRPYTDDQITLVETFAAQAAIAVENMRQFQALEGRLEREAATREILQVISQSRDDETPVFDTILDNAARLCDVPVAALGLLDEAGAHLKIAAYRGARSDFLQSDAEPWPIDSPIVVARAVRDNRVIHVEDLSDDELYRGRHPVRVKAVEEEGIRSLLAVPLVAGNRAIGVIGVYRRERRPFSQDEIDLLQTFAAQAVIAIDNVHQFRELETRLEREAATREILSAINLNRADEQPVFDEILKSALALCHAQAGRLVLVNDARTRTSTVAVQGPNAGTFPVGHGLDLDVTYIPQTSIREAQSIAIDDLRDGAHYQARDPLVVSMVEQDGARSMVSVPLISNGLGIGAISLNRTKVEPFRADEIALVETFAAQAVIAIENVRQFRELQTRLEREAATREILSVISQSRDDETPVFQVILENAARLCASTMARLHLLEDDGQHRRLAAHWGEDLRALAIGEKMPMNQGHPISISITEARVFHIEDIAETELYKNNDPLFRRLVDEEGIGTLLTVPLLRNGKAFGCIALSRRERRAFADPDIELVKTFAAQAVIAIENVRQFRELQTRLEREAATREILQVVSRSRTDGAPVFDLILKVALRLCGAQFGLICDHRIGDTRVRMVAEIGMTEQVRETYLQDPPPLDPKQSLLARCILMKALIHADMTDPATYPEGSRYGKLAVEEGGMRTTVQVPMLIDDRCVGALVLFRKDEQFFTQDQIELLRTFAAQAAIAIENVRTFAALEASNAEVQAQAEEVQALNASLEARVEDQVGEIERMGRLKRFLSPAVADAVVTKGEGMLSSHRALIATLFCDIRGFTAFCERAEPEETIEVLQTYHEELGGLISEHGGGVDKRMGDGIMVIFNDPLPVDDPAGDAVRLAIAMRARMVELCKKWKRLGHRLGFGVGISLGYATVGMVGSEGRFDYTASGTAVNLAARLCDQAGDGDILLSPRAQTAVEDGIATEPYGEMTLKGIQQPVEVFRVTE